MIRAEHRQRTLFDARLRRPLDHAELRHMLLEHAEAVDRLPEAVPVLLRAGTVVFSITRTLMCAGADSVTPLAAGAGELFIFFMRSMTCMVHFLLIDVSLHRFSLVAFSSVCFNHPEISRHLYSIRYFPAVSSAMSGSCRGSGRGRRGYSSSRSAGSRRRGCP